jgi:hypothetical protein
MTPNNAAREKPLANVVRLMVRLGNSLPLVQSFHHAAPICDNGGIKVESIARPATSHRSAKETTERTLVPKRLFFNDDGSPSPS